MSNCRWPTQVQQVTVTESAPIIETGRANVGAVVNRNEIDSLPINGRNFLSYSTHGGGRHRAADFRAGQRPQLQRPARAQQQHLRGRRRQQRPVERQFPAHDEPGGRAGVSGGDEPVRARVRQARRRAGERGFALGHQRFSRATCSCSRATRRWTARNAFATGARSRRSAARTSAPRWAARSSRNRTFFFAAVEYITRHESDVVTISDDNVARINAVLAQRPIPNGGVTVHRQWAVPGGPDRHAGVDQTGSLLQPAAIRVAFRYIFGQDRESNAGGVAIGGLTDRPAAAASASATSRSWAP